MRKIHLIFSILTLGLLLVTSQLAHANPKKNPNVIYIYASDLGKGLLSAYGQKQFTTPNMDALIQKGVSFQNAYGGALSTAARASSLTGYHDCNKNKWYVTTGGVFIKEDTATVRQNESFLNDNNVFLPEDDLYLPQVFKKAGYLTGQIGKLGIGHTSTRQQMERYGWDYFFGFLDHVRSEGLYPPFLFENDQIVFIEGNTRKDGGRSMTPETERAYQERWNMEGKKQYAPDLLLKKAIEFLHECKDKTFFLMYSTPLPHGPVAVPALHPEVAGNEALTPVEKEFASMVKFLDDHVGLIMKELQSLNLEENTLIVLASDNGHDIHYIQKGRIDKPFINKKTGESVDNLRTKFYSVTSGDIFNGNAGRAGLKYSNLEGGINIPLTFYWKNKLKKRVCEDVVAGYDLLPTMADLLGVQLQTPKNGLSLLPVLTKGKKLPKNRYIIAGSDEGPAIITNDGWKLRYYVNRKAYELYNLKKDPEEKYDVILRFPENAEKMEKTLLEECNGVIVNGVLY